MEERTLKRATGSWVVGDQFWDRETELALFIERLCEGAHILVTAPRRIGKTSLLKEASRRLEESHLCLYVDLQKAEASADAVVELSLAAQPVKPAWDRMKSIFQSALGSALESVKIGDISVMLRGGLTGDNWRAKGDEVLKVLAEQDRPAVLFLDEVAILVNRLLRGSDYIITEERRREVDSFLSWLRAASIRHQGRIAFIVTGSIGLEPLVRQAGLSATLNTFTPFALGPWTREVAAECLRALSRGHDLALTEEAIELLLDRLGVCIPHHVQVFFDHVYQAARISGVREAGVELVKEVYDRSMLGIRGHMEFSHMEERLKQALGPRLDSLALDLLTEAAVTGTLTAWAAEVLARDHCEGGWGEPLRDVLEILEHDGYLRRRDGDFVFESGLLRDWWKARFKFAYIPAAGRQP
jgi:hypothetical protein